MSENEIKLSASDQSALAHSKKVAKYIKDIIAENGPISFCKFMDYALYAPGLGYYSVGTQKFGPQGDFVTAPEISSLFSRCLANYCMAYLKKHGGSLFEFGAGTGVMAADILLWLAHHECLPEKYYIMELSADLKARQKETLRKKIPEFFDKIEWLDRLPAEPINAVVLANEVLDAMPVNKFKIQNGKIFEYYVDCKNDHFEWLLEPADDYLKEQVEKLNIVEVDGYESEINLALLAWFSVVADMLDQGRVIIIDYGFLREEFYHPERNMGTLKCHYRHRSLDNPLQLVGIQDITAHVDFTAVGDAATANGFTVKQFSNQAKFLINNGLLELAQSNQTIETAQKIKTLTLPGEMGEIFKVLTAIYP